MCVTTGILNTLTAEELEGVLAHELSHVAHRDVLVMTVASSAGVVAGMVTNGAQYGFLFGGGYGGYGGGYGGYGGGYGGGRGNSSNDDDGPGFAFALIIALVVSLIVYAVSFILTRMLSRYRELCADRSGALLTQKPGALASALVKIAGEVQATPQKDLREVASMNAFFIAPAVKGLSMRTMTSTHPSLEQRLEQLSKVAAELGRPFDGGFLPPSQPQN